MADLVLRIDDQLLEKARKVARERKISLDTVVDQKLKEFVFDYQKKKEALEGLESFYRKCQAKVGRVNWRRDELHER
jgi:hypothetical protein